ncbi:MAG: hypothetical protein IPH28_10430 [Cytophagaceae bacterium]|nr:hypothetical protein [Cytophagaceae bacterium]
MDKLIFENENLRHYFFNGTKIRKSYISGSVFFHGTENLSSNYFIFKNEIGNFLIIISCGEVNRMIYKVYVEEIWQFEEGEIIS